MSQNPSLHPEFLVTAHKLQDGVVDATGARSPGSWNFIPHDKLCI